MGNEASVEGGEAAVPPGVTAAGKQEKERRGSTVHRGAADALPLSRRSDVGATHSPQLLGNLPAQVSPGISKSQTIDALKTAPAVGQNSPGRSPSSVSLLEPRSHPQGREDTRSSMFSSNFLSGGNPFSAVSSAVNKLSIFGEEEAADEEALSSSLSSSSEDEEEVKKKKPPQQKKAGGPAEVAGSSKQGQGQSPQKSPPQKPGSQSPQQDGSPKPSAQIHQLPPKAEKQQQVLGKDKPQQAESPKSSPATGSRKATELQSQCPPTGDETSGKKSLCPLCKSTELNLHSREQPNYNTCTHCKSVVCSLCGFSPPDSVKEWLCLNCQMQWALGGMEPPGPQMIKTQQAPSKQALTPNSPQSKQPPQATPSSGSPQSKHPSTTKPDPKQVVGHGSPQSKSSLNQTCASPADREGSKPPETKEASKLDEQQSIPDTLKPTSTPADSKESASAATPSKCRSELLQETQNEKEMLDPAEIKPGTAASPAPTLQDPAKPAGSSKAGQPASGSPTLDPKKGPLTTRGNPENQVPKVGQGQPPAKSAPPSQAQPPKQESGFFGLSFGGLTESPKTQSTDPRSAAGSVTGKLFGFSGFTEPSKPQPTAPRPAAESVTGKLFGFGGLTEVSKSLTAVQEPTAESITGKSSEPAKQETVAESLTGKLFGFGTSSEPTKPPSEPEPESVTGKFFGIGRITESAKPQPGVDSVSSKLFGFGGSTEPSKPQSSVQEQKMLSFVDSTESTKSQPTTQQTQRESVTEKFSGCTEENKPTTPHPPSESVTRKLFGIDTSSETTKPPIQQPLAGSISGKLFGFAGSTEPNKTQPTAQQPPTESLSGKLFGFSGSPETTKRQPEAQQPPSESLSGKLFGFSGSPETTKRQPEAHQPTAVKIFGFGGSVESTKSTAPKPVDSVSGKMFGFKSSFLSSASNLIASAVQDEQPIPPTQLSPKTSTKDYPQPQENHSLIKNPTEFTKASAPKSSETNCPLCKVELNMGSTDSPNYNTCTECKNIVCNLCGFNPMPHLAKNEWLCLNCQTQRALAGQLGDMGMMPPPMPTPSKLTPNPSAEIKSTPSAIAEVTSTSKTETDTFQIDTTVIETPSDSSTSEANSTKPLAQSVVPSETLTVSLESGPASTTPDPVHEVVVSDSSVEMVCSHLIPCVDPSSQSGSDAKVLSNKVEPTKLISTNQEPSSSPGIIGPSTHEIVSSVEDPTFPIETTYTSTESATSEPSSDISVPELASPELTSPETETIATLVEYSSPVKVSLAEQESNNSSGLVTKSTLDEEVIILDSNSSAQDNEDSEESKAEPSSDLSKIEVPSDNNQYEECSSVSSGPHYEAVGHAHCTEVEEPIISSDPSPSSNAVSCSAESEEIPFEFSSQSEVFEHSVHSETITSTDHDVEHARHSEVTVLNEHEAAQTEQSEQYNYFFKFDSNSEIQQCSTVHDFQSTGVGDPMEAEACVAYVESEGVILKTDCLSIDITTSTEQDPALGKPPIGQEAAFTEPSTSEAEIVTVTTQKADAHCDDIHHPGVDVPVEPKEILSQSSIPLKTACTCIEPETFPTEYVSTECAATPAEPKNAIPDPESLSEDTESIGEQEISSPETPTDASTACTSPLDVVTESISYQSEIIKSPGKTEFQIPDDSHQYKNNTAPREYDISFCDSFNESDIDIVPIEPECDIHEYISKTENIAVAAEPGTALYEQSPQLESLNSKERESFSELSPSINVNMFVAENKTNVLDRPVTPHSVYNAESPTVPPEIIPLSSFASTESFVDAEATTQKFGIENLVTSFDYDASVPQSVSPTFSNSPSPKALPRMKAVEDEEPAMAKEEEQIIVAAINQLNETFKPDTNQQACHQTLGDKGRTPDGITQGSNVDVLQDRGEIKDEVEPLLIEQATNKDNENKDSCCENEKALMQKTITKMNINKELIVNQEHGSGHPINEDNIERIQKHHLHGRLDAKAVNINDLETDTTSKETILGIRSLELKLNTCPHYKDQVLSVQENKDVELDMETGIYSPEERSREGSSSLHASSFTPGTSPTSVSSLDEDSDSSPGHKWISEDSKPRRTRHRQHGQVLPTIEDSSEEEEMREEEDLLREQEKYKGHFYHIKKSSNKKTKKDKEEIRAQRRRERPITPPSNLSPIEDASPTEELRQAEEMEELHRSTSNTPCSEFYPEGFFVRTEKTVPKESEEISLQGPKSQDELYTDALLTPKLSKPSDMNETTKQETGLSPSINETCFLTISSCDTVSILKDYEQEADVEPEKGLLIKQDNCPPPPTPEVIVFSSKDNANDINIEDHIDTGQNVMQESIPSDTHLQKALYPIPDLKITQCSSGEEDIDEEDITTQNQQSALETVVTTAVQADIAEIEPISVICEVPETKVVLPHISPASASDVTSVLLRNHASTFVFEVPQQNTTPGVAETVNVSSFLSDDGASVPSPPNVTEEETISVICQIPEQKDFQNANVTLEFDTGTGVPPEIEPIAVVCEVPQRIASQASYLEKGKLSVSISPDTASNLPSVELEPIVVVCQDLHSITSTTPCPVSTHAPCELLKKTDIDTEPLSVVCEVPLPKKIVKPPATHLQPSSNASQQFPLFPGSVSVTVLDSTLALDKKLPLSFHSEESPFPAVSPVPGACLEFGPSSVFTTLSGLELSTPPISCCSPSTTSTSSLISANISHSTSSSAVAKLNYSASVMVDISPKHSSAHLTSGHSSVSQTVAVSSTLNPVSAPPPILTFYQSTKQPGIILEPILDAISTNAPEKKVTETESLMAFSSTVEVSGHTFSVVTTAPIVFSSPRPTAVVTVSPLPPISQYYPAVSSMVATAIPPTSLTTSITSVPPLPPKTTLLLRGFSQEKNDKPISSSSLDFPFTTLQSSTQHGSAEKQEVKSSINQEPVTTCIPAVPVSTTATTVTMANSTITTTDQMYKPSVPVPSSANEGLVQKSISIDKQPVFVNPTQINQAVGNTQLCPIDSACSPVMTLNLNAPCERRSATSPTKSPLSPRQGKFFHETYVVITLPSEPPSPTDTISTQASTSQDSVKLVSTASVLPVVSTQNKETVVVQDEQKPKKVASSLSHVYSALPSGLSSSLPNLVTQELTTEFKRSTVSLACDTLEGISQTISRETTSVSSIAPSEFVKQQAKAKENGHMHFPRDVVDLSTLKFSAQMTEKGMDLSNPDSGRQSVLSDSSGRQTSAVHSPVVNLSAELASASNLTVVTDSITIVACTATIAYINNAVDRPLTVSASLPMPVQLATSKSFEPVTQIIYKPVVSQPSISDVDFPINLSFGSSTKSETYKTFPSNEKVVLSTSSNSLPARLEAGLTRAVDLTTTKHARALVSNDGLTSEVTSSMFKEDGMPVDLTGGRPAVCCDVVYKLPFAGSCTAEQPTTTLPEDRFGYRDDHYQYNCSGANVTKGFAGLKSSMSDTNLAEAGLFFYTAKNSFEYQNGTMEGAMDLTSGKLPTGVRQYSGTTGLPYFQAVSADEAQFGLNVIKYSNGLVYSSVDAPIISSYAVTTQPGSIFCTSYKDMSKMDTSDFLRPLPTLENQSHPESYDFLSTTAIRDVPTEALSRAFPMVIPTVTTLPGSYLEASLEAISLQSFTTASPQQEYQRERELLELEKMKQLRLAEELEWERQEIQRFREEEQLIVQHELEELQTMKHQLLLQQEEERKAHLMMQQETYVQQKMQLEQIQQLKQQLQEHIDEQKMRQMYPYQNTPAQCSEQILQDVQCLRDVNGQFWPVQDKTTVPSTNVGFESQQASQHLPSHEKPQKDTIAQEPLELCNKIQKLSGKKKIVDSGVQTDGEEVAEKVNAGKRRKNKKSIDSSVQTDDEDHDEWDIPNRSRRRTRSSRSADSEKSKYGSKLSSISIQTVAEISVQTDQSGSLKRPVRAQVDTKVALSPQDILPRTDSADRKSPQRDKNRPTPLEIGYSTHLKADSTVAPSPPKSPKVLYSPVSPLSPKKQIEYSSYERSLRDTSPQKRLGPESIKCSSTGSCVRTVQHTASDGKNLNSPSGHSGKNSHCGLGTQKKVKRTLPNPPQEEEMTSGHAPYSTASARRRLCRNTSMARAKILQDIDRELELVERESSKLRKKQAELDEEEKEIDAKLRYLEMGICRRRDALLKEREKRERAYLQGVAEERDYMSDSEVSNVRETRINDIGLERPRTAPQPDFSQHVPTQTQPKSVYVQPTSPYTLYQYSTSTQAPQQALYQQPSFYHSQQTSPYQTQCVYSSVPTLSYPPASQQHHLSRNYHQGSQILLLQPKSRHTSFSELEPKVNGTYELVRNQSLLIAPPSNEVTYNVSHLGGKYGSLRLGLDERASIASSPMSSISADSYYADMDQHTPKNYVLLNDIGELTKTSTGLSTSFSIPDKDLAKADRLLHAAEMRDLLGPLQISRLHPCMKVQEDAMEEPYELKLLKQQIKQEFRRGPDGLEPTGLHHYYPSDSYRDLAKSEKYTIGRLTLEKQAAKQLPVSLLYQKQAKYKKALVDPKITKFSPIQETRDLVQDYSTYLASSTTSLSGLASRAKLLQDDITFGLRKSLTEHQKYLGSTLGANLAQSLNLGHTLNLSSHRSSLHEETLYASANRSRPSSRPSSVCGLDLSIKRDLSSSSLRLRTESDGISLVRNKPTSLPISQSKGRIPIIAQNSEEESPLSPVGQPMGMARASAGPLPPISADVRDQFGSNHSLPEVQQHMKEESRTSVYDRNLAYLMDNPQGVVSDFEAGRRWSTEVQNVLQEDPHWFDKPRGTNTQYGHIPGWIHGSQNQVGPGFYPFPHTRVKISRDPKDHSIAGNEHGIRVVGGKEIPGSRREIGAYVAQVVPGGPAEQTGKIAEGMQVLEWNNVPLTGKTYEDVQGLVSQPCTEVEICVRQDLNMLSDSDCPQDVQLLNPSKAGERLRSPGIQTTVELHKVSHQYLPSVASVAEKGPHFSTVHHQQSQSASPSGGKKRQSSKSAEVKTQNRPITGDIQLQLNYDKSLGNLIVHVLQARNLAPRDSNGYSDPFVKVYLLPGRGQVMVVQNASVENKRRSKSVQRNPEWNQTVIYKNIHLEQLKKKTLEVSVWDYDRTSSNDFLGEALIDLSTTAPLDNTPHWHTLKEQSESITHGRSHQSSSAQNPKTPVTKSRSHGVFPDPSKVSDLQLPGIEKSHSSPGSSKSSSETHLRSHGPSRSQSKSSVTQAHLEDAGVAIAAAEAAVQQLRLQPTRSSHRSTDGPTAVTTSSGLNLDDAGIDSAIFQIPRLKTIPNGTDKLQGPDSDNEVGKTKVMGEIKIALKKENRTEGEQLIIEILQCRNITYKFKSPDHLPDLYVKLYVVNVATQKRVIKKKTRVCRHDREPSFNETFRFNLNPTGHSLQIFLVSNGGKFVKKTMIGEAYVWLDKVDLRKRTASWHKLLANSPHMHG